MLIKENSENNVDKADNLVLYIRSIIQVHLSIATTCRLTEETYRNIYVN